MNQNVPKIIGFLFLLLFALPACAGASLPPPPESPPAQTGTLQFRANGEDFARQGFKSKDGWQLTFEHIYLSLADIAAYQTDPPYDAHLGGTPQAKITAPLDGPRKVDLTMGAPPLGEVKAPPGHYNAIAWTMRPAEEGYSLVMIGTAEKKGAVISFTVQIEQAYRYTCGEYVGEERLGIVQPGQTATQEITFHFDHLFGDGALPLEDSLNTTALGFEPLAALAESGQVEVDLAALQTLLSPADYHKLTEEILPSLGHTGEGHCQSERL
jgi:hypothetical protein